MSNINTKFLLRIDSWTNWSNATEEKKGANLVLLKGEVGICEFASGQKDANGVPVKPAAVLFKVGDGTSKFSELKWVSGLAADVYDWAKKENPDWADFPALPAPEFKNPNESNGNGFVTGASASFDATTKKLTVTFTRSDVSATGTGKSNKVIDATGLTITKATDGRGVKLDGEVVHGKEYGATDTTAKYTGTQGENEASTYGDEVTIPVPKLTVDEYGHVVAAEEKNYTISIPELPEAGVGFGVVKSGGAAVIENGVITGVNHAATAGHASTATNADHATNADNATNATNAAAAEYAEEAGHASTADNATNAGFATNAGHATSAGIATAATTASKVDHSFTVNGVAFDGSADKSVTIDASSLGLEKVMNFLGVTTTAIAQDSTTASIVISGKTVTAVKGDVVLSGNKEFVFDGSKWHELGDQGSHALKTVTITGDDGLTGGGDLSDNRTITHAVPTGAKEGDLGSTNSRTYIKTVTTDKFGHVTGVETGTETVVDTNTWRKVQVNGTDLLGDAITTKPLNLVAGTNVTLTPDATNGKVTINSSDITVSVSKQTTDNETLNVLSHQVIADGHNLNLNYYEVATKAGLDAVKKSITDLDYADTAVAKQFVTEVDQTDGKISVKRGPVSAYDLAEAGKTPVTQQDYLVFYGGTSTDVV